MLPLAATSAKMVPLPPVLPSSNPFSNLQLKQSYTGNTSLPFNGLALPFWQSQNWMWHLRHWCFAFYSNLNLIQIHLSLKQTRSSKHLSLIQLLHYWLFLSNFKTCSIRIEREIFRVLLYVMLCARAFINLISSPTKNYISAAQSP